MAFRSSNSAASSVGVTSIDVTAPSGVSTGDVVVCAASNDLSGSTITLPSGAVELASSPKHSTADNATTDCGTKVETGTPPATYTFGAIGSVACSAVVAAYSGIDTAAAVNQSSGASSNTALGPPTSIPATGITTTVTCDLVFVGAADCQSSNAQSYTPPTNYTEREDVWSGNFPSLTLADWENQAAGSTGTVTGTLSVASAAAGYMAFLIGLKRTSAPAGAPPGTIWPTVVM